MTAQVFPTEETAILEQESPSKPTEWRRRYGKVVAGSAAEEEIVKQHLPLVKHVVGRLAMTLPTHVDIDDLHSAGLVGLLNAVRQYDPNNGTSFETYARVRIRGAAFDELRRMDWVPRSVHAKARKVQAMMQQLEQQKGEVPSNLEMARALKMPLSDYEELLEEIRPACFLCLDSAQNTDGDSNATQYEAIPDPSQQDPVEDTARREMARLIAARLEQLPEMQRKVLALYYFEDLRLREIAEVFGLTESRICQIHAQAILAIKSYLQRLDTMPD